MQPLILLHGAIGAKDQLQPLADALADRYKVYTLDFSGHGEDDANVPFAIATFAQDVLRLMEREGLQQAAVFGYSMGGYVGMYLALHHPGKVSRLVTLATKYRWDPTIAAKETQMLDADKIALKVPAFAASLQQRHTADWKDVLRKTAAMMVEMGADEPLKPEDEKLVVTPTLVLLGDRDKMVTLEETRATYQALPNGQFGILPNTQHPIEQVDTKLLVYLITTFLQ